LKGVFACLSILFGIDRENSLPLLDWKNVSFVDPIFLGLFVPAVMFAFYVAVSRCLQPLVPILLIASSLTFYVSWGLKFFLILIASMLANFSARHLMMRPQFKRGGKRAALTAIIAGNLCCLGYFKYSGLFFGTIASLGGFQANFANLAIPLGISFYTFQEITLAVDSYRGAYKPSFLKYVLFISFFPHLVAGPLVHHREMMPQFERFRFHWYAIAFGVSLIAIGLFKKICLADPLAPFIQSVFDRPETGSLSFAVAWLGAIAYGFELYFDFSGYSDMALGLARLFGIKLPINFNSPYKAESIIDFWHRWHLSLSRFLREYLYIPLGGNRLGESRRYLNLMVVMLIGGLWHGPNWTFVVWGGMHGIFLAINHAWLALWGRPTRILAGYGGRLLTFGCVTVAWVAFRAPTLAQARELWFTMAGLSETGFADTLSRLQDPTLLQVAVWLLLLFIVTQLFPNSMQVMHVLRPFPGPAVWGPTPVRWPRWRPTALWMSMAGILIGVSFSMSRQLPKQFLYWNF
jgi:alginate O-acetyltransferase complex protein AlgI